MELTKSSTDVDDSIASPVISRSDNALSVKHADGTNEMSYYHKGLDDSLYNVITSPYSVIDSIRKGPVVKLLPLSAEIKVHLDLDINLDSVDLKEKDVLTLLSEGNSSLIILTY